MAPEALEPAQFDPYALGEPPHDLFASLRSGCPVARTDSGAWYLARHADVLAATKDVHTFVGNFREPGVIVPEDEKLISEIAEPRHGWIRRIINSSVAYHKVRTAEPYIRDLCDDLAQRFVAKGGGDLIADYVAPIPSTVIAYLIGVPIEMRTQFAAWGDEVVEGDYARFNRTDRGVGLAGAHPEFTAYIDDEIAVRRQLVDRGEDAPDDLITRLMVGEIDENRLTDVEIRTQIANLIIAGNETTRHLIGNLGVRLARDADLFSRLSDDRTLLDPAIEETLRVDPPVHLLMRSCDRPIEFASRSMAEGDKVIFGIASANRDESLFDEPDQFRADRPNAKQHLAFGGGPHICPGASLARLEARHAIDALLDHSGSITLDGEPRRVEVFWANGWKSVPVVARGA